jgi:uncharacterized protein (TIGR03086 family)
MDHLHALDYSLATLDDVVAAHAGDDLEGPSNCDGWTVRRLASHALNNQLFWAGLVTGEQLADFESTMGAAPIDGDLAPVAADVRERATARWRTPGVLDAMHDTPLGTVPGSAVANFAVIDALAHAWDVSTSLGSPIDFAPPELGWIREVVGATCNDVAIDHGLIKPPASVPADASETERLMAAAGRTIPR